MSVCGVLGGHQKREMMIQEKQAAEAAELGLRTRGNGDSPNGDFGDAMSQGTYGNDAGGGGVPLSVVAGSRLWVLRQWVLTVACAGFSPAAPYMRMCVWLCV